jgi:CubicO group peptidase (beta-lactamase class C family)
MKIIIAAIFVVILLCLPVANAAARPDMQAIDFDALDAYITAQMTKHGIQGIALAITQGTEVQYMKGYGTSGDGRPMTPQTPMYIGSTSKSITALAVAQLVDQGKIDVAEPVQTYIPGFKVADAEASAKITISHLLHHTSGLSEAGFFPNLPDEASKDELVRALAEAQLTQPVGKTFQYFNTGYAVLAVVVENVSGQIFEDYIQEHIFNSLDMTRTYTDPDLARQNGLSQGYSRFFGFTIPRAQPHRMYEFSAGYIISTAEDMAQYAITMNNQTRYNGQRLLEPVTLGHMFAPYQGYGWGWFVSPGHIHHGGANETFKTFLDLYPDKKIGIVLLINQGYMLDHYISARATLCGGGEHRAGAYTVAGQPGRIYALDRLGAAGPCTRTAFLSHAEFSCSAGLAGTRSEMVNNKSCMGCGNQLFDPYRHPGSDHLAVIGLFWLPIQPDLPVAGHVYHAA